MKEVQHFSYLIVISPLRVFSESDYLNYKKHLLRIVIENMLVKFESFVSWIFMMHFVVIYILADRCNGINTHLYVVKALHSSFNLLAT